MIRVLNKETIDRISAGEVVERPSNEVKELVENAIDSGATAITVEIKAGGLDMIRVTDNGCGIDPSEKRVKPGVGTSKESLKHRLFEPALNNIHDAFKYPYSTQPYTKRNHHETWSLVREVSTKETSVVSDCKELML